MTTRTKIALPLFGLLAMLALFFSGWIAFQLYESNPGTEENPGSLTELRDAYFRISTSIQTNFSKFDQTLKKVTQRKPDAAVQQFQNHSNEWRLWLELEIVHDSKSAALNAGPEISGNPKASNDTNPPFTARTELLSLLTNVQQASSNYFAEARYLLINAGKPLIGKRLAECEQLVKVRGANVRKFAETAAERGVAIAKELSVRQDRAKELRERKELQDRIQRLRLTLLLAFVGLCFVFLLGLYRRKHVETSTVIARHAEQRAKLDKVQYFSSQLAQEHAHEIKQPLTAINAHLYTLQKSLPPGSAAHKDATVIRAEISRLDQIVQKFLQHVRSTEPQPVEVTAWEALGEVRDLMLPQLEQQAIKLQWDVQRDTAFCADPQQFKQVLINLVKNAAESIARDGVITLRARTGSRQLQGKDAAVTLIEVEDNGPGIPEQIQANIFDPFFSTKERGSGLGLAVSAGIIEAHGGRLEFDSRVGQGTIFRIVLPTVSQPQQPVTTT